MRYLTGRGNVRCGIHLVREISVGHLSGRESVRRGCAWSGECPSGIYLVGDVAVRGNVCRGCVRESYTCAWVRVHYTHRHRYIYIYIYIYICVCVCVCVCVCIYIYHVYISYIYIYIYIMYVYIHIYIYIYIHMYT